jgi:hypothetical protein
MAVWVAIDEELGVVIAPAIGWDSSVNRQEQPASTIKSRVLP